MRIVRLPFDRVDATDYNPSLKESLQGLARAGCLCARAGRTGFEIDIGGYGLPYVASFGRPPRKKGSARVIEALGGGRRCRWKVVQYFSR